MIASILATFGPWIVGILAAVASAFAVFASAKAKGKAEGRAVAAETIAKDREAIAAAEVKKSEASRDKQTETIQKANDANSQVNGTPIADVHSELRDKWTRD